METRPQRLTSEDLEKLLIERKRFNSSGYRTEEKRRVKTVEEEFAPKFNALAEQERAAIDEVERPRVDNDKQIINLLEPLTIGNSVDITYKGIYHSNVVVGFQFEEAVQLARYALETGIDLRYFMVHCDFTRKALAWNWDRKQYGWESWILHQYIFSEWTYTSAPNLQKVDSLYKKGIDILFPTFSYGHPDVARSGIQQAKPSFTEGYNILETLTGEENEIQYYKETAAFFKFMTTNEALILSGPTHRKYIYEERSFKEK